MPLSPPTVLSDPEQGGGLLVLVLHCREESAGDGPNVPPARGLEPREGRAGCRHPALW